MIPKTIGEIVQELFGFVERNLSEGQQRKSAVGEERGAGKCGTDGDLSDFHA
jgi:hypothetical protein